MVRRKLIITLIILAIVATISLTSIRPVGATGNTVYFSPNNTPATAPGNTISISVMADTVGTSSSSGINGWDLVITDNDPSMANLNPVSISIARNLLTPFGTVGQFINCVNGVGSGCDYRDGPGIIHTAAALQGSATPTPVSGRIAIINFTTVGPGPLTIGILSPCPPNPNPMQPSFPCDVLTDGSPNPNGIPHTTLSATYGTPTTPDFRLSAPNGTAPASINPGATATSLLNVTSLTGATGSVSFTRTIYPSVGLTFSCTTITLVANSRVSSTCTFSSNVPGFYFVTVNATNTGAPSAFHLAAITITVSDFKATSNVANLGILKGNSTASANITATSINGFSGSLTISGKATTSPATTGGLLVSCSPTTISITPTSTAQSKCTFNGVKSNKYSVALYANYSFSGGFVARNVGLIVVVQDFQITTNPGLLNLGAGSTGSSVVSVSSFPSGQGSLGFSGSVAITTIANSPKLQFSCPTLSGQSVTVTSGAAAQGTCTFGVVKSVSTPPGAYALNITGTFTRGTITITNSTIISVMVAADFSITASNPQMSVGTTGNSTISVTGYGISSPISLSYNVPSGLTCSTEPATVSPNNTAILGCTSNNTGQYSVSITARAGTVTHIAIAAFTSEPVISIAKVIASTTTATVGDKVDVTVTVSYMGATTNFTLQIHWGSVTVASKNFTATAGQGPTDYKVTWDTTRYAAGTDIISANIPPLNGQINNSGNSLNGPSFTLQPASTSPFAGTTTIAIIGVIVAAAAIAGAVLFLRRRKKPAAPVIP